MGRDSSVVLISHQDPCDLWPLSHQKIQEPYAVGVMNVQERNDGSVVSRIYSSQRVSHARGYVHSQRRFFEEQFRSIIHLSRILQNEYSFFQSQNPSTSFAAFMTV